VQESKHFGIVRRAVGHPTATHPVQFRPIRPESNCSPAAQRHPLDYEIKMDDGRNENGIFNELLPRQRPNELLAEQWSGDKTMEMRRSSRVDWGEGGEADQAAAVKWGEGVRPTPGPQNRWTAL